MLHDRTVCRDHLPGIGGIFFGDCKRGMYMKILIADDERLTREGLMRGIDWASLGIDRVLDAENGVQALSLFKQEQPDIILTDVRMPQMDGIELATAVTGLVPECPVIFMSGYSDKEYLKAAIKLHAIRYVEKPIQLEEVTEAVREAMESCQRSHEAMLSYDLLQREATSRLALAMTKTGFKADEEVLRSLCLSSEKGTFFTMTVHVFPSLAEYLEETVRSFLDRIARCCQQLGVRQVHTAKHQDYLLVHFLYPARMDSYLYKELTEQAAACCTDFEDFTMCFGRQEDTLTALPDSYHSAVILQQNAFFSTDRVLHYREQEKPVDESLLSDLRHAYLQAIDAGNLEEIRALVVEFYNTILDNRSFLPDVIRDIYYRLLQDLHQMAYENRLSDFHEGESRESQLALVSRCRHVKELQDLFLRDYDRLLAAYHAHPEDTESSTIFLIRDYIRQHYADQNLSIKAISDHVHLSTSYLCTYFKNETGQTMNQYIAAYRMGKAKKFLSDPRNKISEISAMVGYADGNYFGKSFKKYVGLSPSEYRESQMADAEGRGRQ